MTDNKEEIKQEERITAFDRFLRAGVTDREKYTKWQSGLFVVVPAKAKVLYRSRFNKNDMHVLGERDKFKFLNPLFHQYLFVPLNSTSIDYEPKKILTKNGVNLDIDPVIRVRIEFPQRYYLNSNNALADLKDTIFSILGSYIAEKDMNEIIKIGEYPLGEEPFKTRLAKILDDYGLVVEKISNKPVQIPKEMQQVNLDIETAKGKIQVAKHAKEEAELKSEAEMTYQRKLIESAKKAREMGLSDQLIEKLIDNNTVRNAPQGANIFIGGSAYNPSWVAMANQRRNLIETKEDDGIITYDEDGNIIEGSKKKAKKR